LPNITKTSIVVNTTKPEEGHVLSSPPIHKPPMDPVGAATCIGGATNNNNNLNHAQQQPSQPVSLPGRHRHVQPPQPVPFSQPTVSLPPAPPGFMWCMTTTAAGNGAAVTGPTGRGPVLAPTMPAAGAPFGLPYVDINQVLVFSSISLKIFDFLI